MSCKKKKKISGKVYTKWVGGRGKVKGLLPYPVVAKNVSANEYMLLLQREETKSCSN